MSEEERTKVLEDIDEYILRAVATRFVIVADREILAQWCARYPEVAVFMAQLRESSNLALQLAGGKAKQTKGGLLILDGGKSE